MADCPGVLHLALMADGGLARLRVPGGSLSSGQARAIADAAERLGSGVVDLTNRANLQIRGLAAGAGPQLAIELEKAGFRFRGEADRRRNVLLDPFSGVDPRETLDLRPLGRALEEALVAAPWIGGLSPKFSFVLDGGGASFVSTVKSDVTAIALPRVIAEEGIEISAGGYSVRKSEAEALSAMLAVAEAAAAAGPDVRVAWLGTEELRRALGAHRAISRNRPSMLSVMARYGYYRTPPAAPPHLIAGNGSEPRVAAAFAVPVGRLDGAMIRFIADVADDEGEGRIALAPWSAVVVPGLHADRVPELTARSAAVGFTPPTVAERLGVVACAGAPACERAREQAKALGAEVLKLASAEPERLPAKRRTMHLSACPKGCAGSAPADLLLLGDSATPGWSIHDGGAPRAPGELLGRSDEPTPASLLALLAR